MYRSRLSIRRDCQRFVDYHVYGPIYDIKAGFADRAQKGSVIEHLVRVCGSHLCIHTSGYHYHWNTFLECIRNDVGQVRDSGPDSGYQYRRSAGCVVCANLANLLSRNAEKRMQTMLPQKQDTFALELIEGNFLSGGYRYA